MSLTFQLFLILATVLIVNASIWATEAEEALDEENDAEIFRSVYTSMQKYYQRHKHPRHKRAETNVCYGDLGCFDTSGPFSYLDMTPSPPNDIRTRFLMYPGRRAGRSKNLLDVPFENMTIAWDWADSGGFNKSLPTKIIVHGFGSSCTSVWVYEMRSALMAVEECNIICVDWEAGAVIPNYVRAAANTRLVGAQLARLLRGLTEKAGIIPEHMHLIGFSLGAHVAGFAGYELGGNISRITGLDPAGPLFESQDPRVRLDSGDAHFVDVIHSNGENLILGGLGSWQPMGDVDFYPNGGRMQKGCSNLFVGAVSDIIWSSAVEGRSLCNHRRAYKFFTDSVSPRCHFPAFPCDTYENFLAGKCFPCTSDRKCGNMGYYSDKSTGRGQLYLITRDEEPFCAHQYHVKIESAPSETSIVSYGKILITLIGESDLNETFTMTHKDDAELKLGSSLSKILVPHPVLGEPIKVQVLYLAYSGWLSSGLARWKIEKVSFTDSFGKILSVCKKGLDLETGIPVLLSLHEGDCIPPWKNKNSTKDMPSIESNETVPRGNDTYNEWGFYQPIAPSSSSEPTTSIIDDRKDDDSAKLSLSSNYHINIPWKPIATFSGGGNSLDESDDSLEQSRALNTRAVKISEPNASSSHSNSTLYSSTPTTKEVVEPILKPTHLVNKIARSHDIQPPEITEPILSASTITQNLHFKQQKQQDEWIPTTIIKTTPPTIIEKRLKTEVNHRHSRNNYKQNLVEADLSIEEDPKSSRNIVSITVQLLPQRLATMLEQAERYARMTLLPLISAHTPKILTDLVNTFTTDKNPKYLPLTFEEVEITVKPEVDHNVTNEVDLTTKSSILIEKLSTNQTEGRANSESVFIVYPQNYAPTAEASPADTDRSFSEVNEVESKAKLNIGEIVLGAISGANLSTTETTTKSEFKRRHKLYVNLPVYNETELMKLNETKPALKYIPLSYEGGKPKT